jgi:hypothetical protein
MRERNAFEKSLLGNKRALQGGVYNYLGKQKTVNAPLKWKSSPEHPVAYLTYITKEEADILIKKNIYGSLKDGKPNRGPFGIASLQGSGGGSEGAGGDAGGSPGGNDSPGGNGSPGGNDSPGGGTAGAAGAAGAGGNTTSQGEEDDSNNQAPGGPGQQSIGAPPGAPSFDSLDTIGIGPSEQSFGMSEQGFGISPQDSMVGPSMNSISEEQEQEQSPPSYSMARLSPIGIQAYNMSLANPTRSAADKAMGFAMSPVGTIAATVADTSMRGVTAPNDYSQVTNSVQNSISPSVDTSGGIASLSNTYKPLDNSNAYIPYTRKPFFTMDPLTGVFKSLI